MLARPPPDGQRVEIIEIGVSALDLTSFEITARESVLVKPVSSEVSAFCTELTHITPEMTAGGVGLAEACAWLRDRFCSAGRMWGSWGSFDRKLFEAQCAADCVPYPFGAHHANLKRVYARLTKRKQESACAAHSNTSNCRSTAPIIAAAMTPTIRRGSCSCCARPTVSPRFS